MHILFNVFKFVIKFLFIFFVLMVLGELLFDCNMGRVGVLVSLILTFAIIYREKVFSSIKLLFGKVKSGRGQNNEVDAEGEKHSWFVRELPIIVFCLILACIATYFITRSHDNLLSQIRENSQQTYADVLVSNQQAYDEFNAAMEKNKEYFSQRQTQPNTSDFSTSTSMLTEGVGVDISGFRERIGTLAFIKDYLVALAGDKREDFTKKVVYEHAGQSCEEGLKNAKRIYQEFCDKLRANLQTEIKNLYGEEVSGGDFGNNNPLAEVTHEDLEGVFADQQTELLASVIGDSITILFAPFTAQCAASIVTGTAGGPIGLLIACGSLALDAYQFFEKRPKDLDAIAGKLQDSVNLYQENVYMRYMKLAEANLEAANSIAFKIAENAKTR